LELDWICREKKLQSFWDKSAPLSLLLPKAISSRSSTGQTLLGLQAQARASKKAWRFPLGFLILTPHNTFQRDITRLQLQLSAFDSVFLVERTVQVTSTERSLRKHSKFVSRHIQYRIRKAWYRL
jgi:hypothetical protein